MLKPDSIAIHYTTWFASFSTANLRFSLLLHNFCGKIMIPIMICSSGVSCIICCRLLIVWLTTTCQVCSTQPQQKNMWCVCVSVVRILSTILGLSVLFVCWKLLCTTLNFNVVMRKISPKKRLLKPLNT